MRVLVIDDDAFIRSSLRRLLIRKYRAVVAEAADGLLGIQHLIDHSCDLVLLDVHMRGMGGLETLEAIRRSPRHRATPVIMLTGDSDASIVANALQLGVADFLVKPVDATVLFERITTALTRAGKAGLLHAGHEGTAPHTAAPAPAPAPAKAPVTQSRVLADGVKRRALPQGDGDQRF